MIEVSLVSALVGVLAGVGLASWEESRDRARNAAMLGNVRALQVALEQYAGEHDGSFPRSPDPRDPARTFEPATPAGLGLAPYLAGGRYPASPWGREGGGGESPNVVKALVAPGGEPLNSAADIGAGDGIIKGAGTLIGPGGVYPRVGANPTEWPRTAFGNLLYSRDPDKGIVLAYGVGKRGRDAVIVAGFCNDGATSGAGGYQRAWP